MIVKKVELAGYCIGFVLSVAGITRCWQTLDIFLFATFVGVSLAGIIINSIDLLKGENK